jgi:hypothetical protein
MCSFFVDGLQAWYSAAAGDIVIALGYGADIAAPADRCG